MNIGQPGAKRLAGPLFNIIPPGISQLIYRAVHDEDCIAEARVVHRGRTSIVVEADIKTVADRLVAKTLATFIVLRKPE